MIPVSAVIITYNEEYNLHSSLSRLKWCDEIVVVDCGSTDATLEICRSYHCRIYYRKFDGYGSQKQFAVNRARNEWVLCLDADEVLTDESVQEIKNLMQNPVPGIKGYMLPISFVFMGKEFRYGKEYNRYFLRLFSKKAGNFDNRMVHEGVQLKGEVKKLKHKVLHYSYQGIHHYFDKFNKYTTYGAELYFKQGRKKSLLAVVLAIPANFLKYYFLERNIFNGIRGFYWSAFNAFYHFVKYIKLRELYDSRQAISQSLTTPLNSNNKTLGNSSLPVIPDQNKMRKISAGIL